MTASRPPGPRHRAAFRRPRRPGGRHRRPLTRCRGKRRRAIRTSNARSRRELPRRGRGRRRHRRRRRTAARRHALAAVALHRAGRDAAQFRAERAARRRLPPRQSAGSAEGSARPDGLDHHGAGGHAADVGLELDLRGDGPARHRHRADGRARDAVRARGARRHRRDHRRVPRRQGRADHRAQRCRRSPTGSTRSWRSRASARSPSTPRTAATASCSSTPTRWVSRLRPTRRRTSRRSGLEITRAADEQFGFRHPELPEWDHISFCQFTAPLAFEDGVAVGQERGGDPSRQDRPLTLRHRLFRAARGAARQGRAQDRRSVRRPLDHRFGVPLPHRGGGAHRRPAGDRAVAFGARVDHRDAPAHARSRRSVAGRLPLVRHLADAQAPERRCARRWPYGFIRSSRHAIRRSSRSSTRTPAASRRASSSPAAPTSERVRLRAAPRALPRATSTAFARRSSTSRAART